MSLRLNKQIKIGSILAALVFLFYSLESPAAVIRSSYVIQQFNEEIDFTKWIPYTSKNEKTSETIRRFDLTIKRRGRPRADYVDYFGTTSPAGIDYQVLSGNAAITRDEPGRMPDRLTYTIKVVKDQFTAQPPPVNLKYELTYWNNIPLDKPLKEKLNDSDVTKIFPYAVENYHLTMLFPPNRTFRKIRFLRTEGRRRFVEEFTNTKGEQKFELDRKGIRAGAVYKFMIDLAPQTSSASIS